MLAKVISDLLLASDCGLILALVLILTVPLVITDHNISIDKLKTELG